MEPNTIIFENYLYLIPLFPLLGAIFNGLLGHYMPKRIVHTIAVGAVFLSFLVSCLTFYFVYTTHQPVSSVLYNWISSGKLNVTAGFLVDSLSAVMLLVVTGVSSVIHLYSIGYMAEDKSYARYFSYLNLFVFAMILLVMGDNLVMMFIGWEGVGLCSYLLIGFWFEDMEKSKAGQKAFIVNRIGDFGFILGILLIFLFTGAVDFVGVKANLNLLPDWAPTAICLLLFLGATGKSAQIPLYVWLPDAMAGPTPVSALIHAATMVTAGVYMIVKLNFLYLLSPTAMGVVATVGAVTAFFAATIGIAQNDIKKVLAYSTVSQLGYMFLAVGVGAFSAGIFHLMTHAFFKACLFLGAGSVIHAMGGIQNIKQMGGLLKKMPLTGITFIISTLAIMGFPLTAGFFSKDEILWNAAASPNGSFFLWGIGFITAGMTAFYMWRMVYLTFSGESAAPEEVKHHLHESPAVMTIPLVILAVLALVGGLVGIPAVLGGSNHFHHFLQSSISPAAEYTPKYGHAMEWILMIASVAVGFAGWGLAHVLYFNRKSTKPKEIAQKFPNLHDAVSNKWFIDELYDYAFVQSIKNGSHLLWTKIDDFVINGMMVLGSAKMVEKSGHLLKYVQSGNVQTYAFGILLGIIVICFYLI